MIRLFPRQTLRDRATLLADRALCLRYLEPLLAFGDRATIAETAATFGFDVIVTR